MRKNCSKHFRYGSALANDNGLEWSLDVSGTTEGSSDSGPDTGVGRAMEIGSMFTGLQGLVRSVPACVR